MPEDGELPAAGPAAQQEAEHDDERSPGKRKHAPIVWHTPPKQARGELPHVGSLKGALDALDGAAGAAGTAGAAGAAGAAPKTAAERALEEVAAFAAAQVRRGMSVVQHRALEAALPACLPAVAAVAAVAATRTIRSICSVVRAARLLCRRAAAMRRTTPTTGQS